MFNSARSMLTKRISILVWFKRLRSEKEKQQMKVELDDIRTQLEHMTKTRASRCRFPFAMFKINLIVVVVVVVVVV